MRNLKQIYSEYKIMPSLGQHQVRVASVAKMICDFFVGDLDRENVITACLFHDMGNIIKSDLNYFSEFLEPEGLDYWQKVKDEFIKKYDNDVHKATYSIVKELKLSENALKYIEGLGFSKLEEINRSDSYEQKICSYADMRVSPYGILSIKDRTDEGRKRYGGRKDYVILSKKFDDALNALMKIEKDIFSKVSIKPEDINDKSVKGIIKNLENIYF